MSSACGYQGPDRRAGCDHADAAAEKAVRKVFAMFGVDVSKPDQVSAFQQDLRFGGFLRKAASRGVLALVSTIAASILVALWYGLRLLIKGEV